MTKLKPATVRRLTEAIGKGLTYGLACKAAGISETAFWNWMRVGRQDIEDGKVRTVKAKFVLTIEQAEAEQAEWLFGQVTQAAREGDWKAAAWGLERRHKYVKPPTVVVNVAPEKEAELELAAELDRVDPKGE